MRSLLLVSLIAATALAAGKSEPDSLHAVPLRRPEMHNGVMCIGTIFVDNRGRVRSCRLAQDATLAGHRLPRLTVVRFDTSLRLMTAFLGKEVELEGHILRGPSPLFPTQFYPNGRVKSGHLAYDDTVDRAHCRRAVDDGSTAPVEFHDNGRLARCEAAGDFVGDGCLFRRGDIVQADRDGRMHCVR